MTINSALYSSNSDEWPTPQWLFDLLHAEFAFTLDPCAQPDSAKCKKFYTPEQDGLSEPCQARLEQVDINITTESSQLEEALFR